MITFTSKGDWSATIEWLKRKKDAKFFDSLDRFGREGVEALKAATPIDSGETAESWNYEIIERKGYCAIHWTNGNVKNGIPIAILIQYGHATKNGGYVQGRDFINPALRPVFDAIAENITKEVRR